MDKRLFLLATGAAALPWLGGCATLDQLSVELRSFGEWPAGRAPGRYAFDRLPSQQHSSLQQALEDAAAAALRATGFVPAPAGEQPDVLVQLGARVSRSDPSPWDDPLWWSGGWGVWRHGPWRGPLWQPRMRLESPRYDRQVALLLRDRASGRPLYEAQASTEGYQSRLESLLVPMMRAALADFPASKPEPHAVSVPL